MSQATTSQQLLFGKPKRNVNTDGKHRCVCSSCRRIMSKQPGTEEEEAYVEADAILDNKPTVLYWCKKCTQSVPEMIVPDGTRMRTDYEGNHVVESTSDRENFFRSKQRQTNGVNRLGRAVRVQAGNLTLI